MQKAGGWTEFRYVTDEDIKVFEDALTDFVGSFFESPLIVATQIVNGTNYKFIGNARRIVAPEYDGAYTAEVFIYKPIEGKPTVTEVKEIE